MHKQGWKTFKQPVRDLKKTKIVDNFLDIVKSKRDYFSTFFPTYLFNLFNPLAP